MNNNTTNTTNPYITKADKDERTILCALAKTLEVTFTGSPKTSWRNIAQNVYNDFLLYAGDEASNFLIERITDLDGEIMIDRVIEELDEFIVFGLRENDINEYDYE